MICSRKSGSHVTRRWREKDWNRRSPARETTLQDCLLIEEVRFAADSPLEGRGFEPSVPVRERRESDESISLAEWQVPEGSNRAVPQSTHSWAGTEWS